MVTIIRQENGLYSLGVYFADDVLLAAREPGSDWSMLRIILRDLTAIQAARVADDTGNYLRIRITPVDCDIHKLAKEYIRDHYYELL